MLAGEDENAPQSFNNNLGFKVPKYSNAYMLVYIRIDDWERIQCNVVEEDIAEPLRVRFKVGSNTQAYGTERTRCAVSRMR